MVGESEKGGRGQAQVAPSFKDAVSNILQRSDTLWEGIGEKATLFHQLEDEVGDLQDDVEDFASSFILAVRMLEIETAVLLHVEAFILDFPTQTAALIAETVDIVMGQGEVR